MKPRSILILKVIPCTMLLLFPGSHVVVGLLGTSAECRAAEFRTKPGFRARDISNDGSRVLWFLNDRSSWLLESRDGETWQIPNGSVKWIDGSGDFVAGSIWSQNGDVQLLGGQVWDVSSDGQTVVGRFDLSCVDRFNCVESGFLWTDANGMRALPPTEGFDGSHAFGVSADGRVAVGRSSQGGRFIDEAEATIWINHEDGEIETMGLGQPNGEKTGAAFVSDDGSVVTGVVGKNFTGWLTAFRNDPEKTFRWTETEGMVTLDLLSGTVASIPTGISGDGSFIVGNAEDESGRMFVWDGQHGTRDLETALIKEHGLDSDIFPVADGEILWVTALSSDGTALAGSFGGTIETTGPQTGWVAYLDRPLVVTTGVAGDFNGNADLDVADLDLLAAELQSDRNVDLFDVNDDSVVDFNDHRAWVHDLAKTYFGDTDLDGEFNSRDLVNLFVAGEYEDAIQQNSTWASGDWNGDGDFTSGDLVVAFEDGGFEQGPRAAAVPEPSTLDEVASEILVKRAGLNRYDTIHGEIPGVDLLAYDFDSGVSPDLAFGEENGFNIRTFQRHNYEFFGASAEEFNWLGNRPRNKATSRKSRSCYISASQILH